MFNKIFKLAFALLLIVFVFTNSSEAQTKKLTYPIIYISPLIGVQFPIMGLNDNYKPSWNGGLDHIITCQEIPMPQFYLMLHT